MSHDTCVFNSSLFTCVVLASNIRCVLTSVDDERKYSFHMGHWLIKRSFYVTVDGASIYFTQECFHNF